MNGQPPYSAGGDIDLANRSNKIILISSHASEWLTSKKGGDGFIPENQSLHKFGNTNN